MEELDEASRVAVMSARGTDRRGQGGASATIRSTVSPDGPGTRVDVVTDFAITGRLARFGRGGMIEDVSKRLLREFASCLQASLDGGGEVAAPESPTAPAPPATAEAAPAGEPEAGEAAAAAATAEAAAGGQPVAPPPPAPAAPPPRAPAAAPPPNPQAGATRAPRPRPQARPLNALDLVAGVLKDRLAALVRRLAAWLRRVGRGS
jgi:hypothetical protein